jgi:hypothetical protein
LNYGERHLQCASFPSGYTENAKGSPSDRPLSMYYPNRIRMKIG